MTDDEQLYRIVPDIHEKDLRALRESGSDIPIIFLGDWFDSFTSTKKSVHQTVDDLLHFAENPDNVFLWGNHDHQYGGGEQVVTCSGFKTSTWDIVHERVPEEVWQRFKFWVQVGETLISHAGFNVHPAVAPLGGQPERWALEVGRSRGGYAHEGGPLWLDFREEFRGVWRYTDEGPTPQIFGHSHVRGPCFRNGGLCLDDDLQHTALLHPGGMVELERWGTWRSS